LYCQLGFIALFGTILVSGSWELQNPKKHVLRQLSIEDIFSELKATPINGFSDKLSLGEKDKIKLCKTWDELFHTCRDYSEKYSFVKSAKAIFIKFNESGPVEIQKDNKDYDSIWIAFTYSGGFILMPYDMQTKVKAHYKHGHRRTQSKKTLSGSTQTNI